MNPVNQKDETATTTVAAIQDQPTTLCDLEPFSENSWLIPASKAQIAAVR